MSLHMSRRLALTGATSLFAVSALPARAQSAPVAETRAGKVQGLTENGVKVFKGVRYGAPTARFQPPKPPTPWAGVAETTAYGAGAPQMAGGGARSLTGPGGGVSAPSGSEDCLFLNVWTPALDGKKRPVMVWLHGGGFATGSGSSPWYDGVNIARKQDIVLVTINHRLNLFGYTCLTELGGERFKDSVNAGMLDIVQALHWVRDNIERFGGDPKTVMIHGESGGGRKVSCMMALEPGRGLFHRAAVQSGSALRMDSLEVGTERAGHLLKALGLGPRDVERLATLPMEDLCRATAAATRELGQFRPAIDGRSLKRHPFDPDASPLNADVPMLIGTNRTEASFMLGMMPGIVNLSDADLSKRVAGLVPPAEAEKVIATYRRIYPGVKNDELLYMAQTDRGYFLDSTIQSERKAAQGAAPVYAYGFYRETPVETGRIFAPHASEIPFVFDSLAKAPTITGPVTPEAQKLADQMSAAWATFARTGKPAAPGLPAWPTYDAAKRQTMILNYQSRVESDPRGEQRRMMLAYGSEQMRRSEGPPPG